MDSSPGSGASLKPWDVFLSYSRADATAVEEVQRRLADQGISTFLDRDQLTAGLPWPEALEEGLKSSRAVAVFLGRDGLGLWQKREIGFALDRQVELERTKQIYPVIPVLLEGAEVTGGFLFLNTWIDLRQAIGTDEAISHLIEAIRAGERAVGAAAATWVCPYRGLQPFGESDAGFYFGREEAAQQLLEKVTVSKLKLVAVIGASGSGKSSVVTGGLFRLLRRQRPPQPTWDTFIFTPGDHPWRRLADGMLQFLEPDASETDKITKAGALAEDFARGQGALQSSVRRILELSKGTNRLLVVIDQFEELFTLTPEPMRKPFIDVLLQAADVVPMSVVLTLRADFFSPATNLTRSLTDRISSGHVILGPMLESELRNSIEKPAKRVGLTYDPGLVDRILEDVSGQPGSLPLLEYALTELWKNRSGNRLTYEAYKAAGGVSRGIATRAERVLSGLKEEQQAIAQRLFTRLVRVLAAEEEGADTRQRARRADVGEDAWQIAQVFAQPDTRLLVVTREAATGYEIVEVSHEALIRGWQRLRQWIKTNRDFLLWRQELQYEIAKWERSGRDEAALLRGDLLAKALEWLKKRGSDLNGEERQYIRWTIEDDYQVVKITADAPNWIRSARGDILAEWLAVAFLRGDTEVVTSDHARRAGDDLRVTLAGILRLAGRRDDALGFARAIENAGKRVQTLTAFLPSILAAGDSSLAAELAHEIVAIIMAMGWDGRRHRLALCAALAQGGAVLLLAEVLDEIKNIGKLIADIGELIAETVAETIRRDAPGMALRLGRELPDTTHRAEAMVQAAAELKDIQLGREAFSCALEAAPQRRTDLLAKALKVVAAPADVNTAISLSGQISEPATAADGLSALTDFLLDNGDNAGAGLCADAAASAIARITNDWQQQTALKKLSDKLLAAALTDKGPRAGVWHGEAWRTRDSAPFDRSTPNEHRADGTGIEGSGGRL
jgi:hypothetical protein